MSKDKKSIVEELKESRSFILAAIIIGAYIIFFGTTMYQNPTNYEGMQAINATYGTIVAAVVGYYFGQRPVQKAEEIAEENKNKFKKEAGKAVDEIEDGLIFYKTLFNKLKEGKT